MTTSDEEKAADIRATVERMADYRVLPRMRAHGFWPKGQEAPPDPPDEAKERAELEAQKRALAEQVVLTPAQLTKALDDERARRIEESRAKRKTRLEAREKERVARVAAWAKARAAGLVHAGVGVSGGLEDKRSDEGKLLALGLPVLHDAGDLARALGVELKQLRFLTFHRRSARMVHYQRFTLPKKSGGVRHISAPKPALKRAQRYVFDAILARAAGPERLSPHAHGFIVSRHVVSNAAPHVKQAVVVNLDLKDFFPSITFARVRGLFRGLGYSGAVATLLALLTTEAPRAAVDISVPGTSAPAARLHIALAERQLPQGACTSPALTNLLCRRLDARLFGAAKGLGFAYTRYADDLTFSAPSAKDVSALLFRVRAIVVDEGLRENEAKTRVMRRGRRQEVTGVIVNDKPGVAREDVRRLRAILHQAKTAGLAAQRRPDEAGVVPSEAAFIAELRGRIAWVQMVDRVKGDRLRAALDALLG